MRVLAALGALLVACVLCAYAPGGARAHILADLPPAATGATSHRGGVAPTAVPDIQGPGHFTTGSRLWLKTTNIGVMGNPFTAESDDPSAQWPGASGVEYLFYWGLWVGAVVPGESQPQYRYRVSQNTEWRPPSLDPVDHIYETRPSDPGTLYWVDDDHDGKTDEEFMNGKDDDGDGRIDEDCGAQSDRQFTLEMRDDTPQSAYTGNGEAHIPLGLRVRQTVYSFETDSANDFVATRYEITNMSGHELDSVFVGFLVDQDCGPKAVEGHWGDDLPEPRIPSATYGEVLPTSDPRYDPKVDPTHQDGFCTITSYRVCGFCMTDDDGDNGQTPGASTFLLLDHTTDVRGDGVPSQVGFHTLRFYRPGVPYSSGGAPTVDLERYQAMAQPARVSNGLPALARPADAQKDDYSALCSVGPYAKLAAGQTIYVTVALGVWPIDYTQPVDLPGFPGRPNPARYQRVLDGARATQLFYRGTWRTPPPDYASPQAEGRETYVTAPPEHDLSVCDCHFNPDSTSDCFDLNPGKSLWFNFNCDYCDAVKGKLPRHWTVPLTPNPPQARLLPGDHQVAIDWDNKSETVPDRPDTTRDPNKGTFKLWGYRLYRAAGFTRAGGATGPSDGEWELVANLRRFDALEPLVDSVDTNGDGVRDSIRATPDVLLDLETGRRIPAVALAPLTDPATGDTVFSTGIRPYIDYTCRCSKIKNPYKVAHYPVGRYEFVDTKVLDGFLYFYAITAVDSSGSKGVDGSPGTFEMSEGRKFAVEADAVTPHAAVAGAGGATRSVIVVPNPYRGHAAWDLNPSPSDPTGAHVDFLHLPAGAWTLRIFTLAGDLVTTIPSGDLTVLGRPQQEDPADGQASWDLLSRNGQDVASGIYLFSVQSAAGIQRGKFVVIR